MKNNLITSKTTQNILCIGRSMLASTTAYFPLKLIYVNNNYLLFCTLGSAPFFRRISMTFFLLGEDEKAAKC